MPDHAQAESARATPLLGLRATGAAALVALVALVVSLERWIGFDDAVWRAVLELRGCSTDLLVDRVVDFATYVLTALLVVAAVRHARARGLRSTWPWVVITLLGLMASRTLKNLLTRERPSALPDVALGFSFPSAHVMNSLVATMAITALTSGLPRRGWWRMLAVALTVAVTVGRVMLGRHWASDALGGGLAALVLVGLGVPALLRRPLVAPLVLALTFVVGFVVDQRLGAAGLRLPAPLVAARGAAIDIDVGRARALLSGNWAETGEDRNVGSFVWLDGSGTIPIEVPGGTDLARPLQIAIGGRSERVLPACLALTVDLNGHELRRFVPFSGWREYRLALGPGALRVGRNELTVSAATRHGPARFAVVYARLARSGD